MTVFMISGMVAFATVIFLLWCFYGFTRDLRQGKTMGLLVRPDSTQKVELKRNARRMIQTSVQTRRYLLNGSSKSGPSVSDGGIGGLWQSPRGASLFGSKERIGTEERIVRSQAG